jgi:hypothetical protein
MVRIQLQRKMASPSMQETCNRRGFTQRPSTAPSAYYSFDSENSTASNTPRPSIYTISKNSVLDDRMWASASHRTRLDFNLTKRVSVGREVVLTARSPPAILVAGGMQSQEELPGSSETSRAGGGSRSWCSDPDLRRFASVIIISASKLQKYSLKLIWEGQ